MRRPPSRALRGLCLALGLGAGAPAWAGGSDRTADPLAGPEEDPFLTSPPLRPQPEPPLPPAPPAPKAAPAPPASQPAPAEAPATPTQASTAAPAPEAAAPPPAAAPAGVPFEGIVREKGLRDPLPNVRLHVRTADGREREVATDAEGRFSFPDLPPGEIEVRLSGPRLRAQRTTERLQPGKRTTAVYYLERLGNPFQAVVRGQALRKEVSEQVLDVQELRRIPGTQGDTLKAVQNLPGVARAPFISGLLIVWGSAPGDTRVYADGVRIPRIYHFGAFRSTINSEFVSELSFRPGAYGAEFGRGLGGIIDVKTRTPKSDRIHGSVTLDLIDGSLTLEGPITKKLHVAVGARVSWISVFLPIFNRSSFQLSPFYWDYQLALRYQATPRDDLDLFVFGSTDNVSARVENPDPNLQIDVDSKSYFSRARLRWTHRFSPSTQLYVMPSFGADTFRVDPGDTGVAGVALRLSNTIYGYNLRSELHHRALPQLDLYAGLDFEGNQAAVDVLAPAPGSPAMAGGSQQLPQANVSSIREASTIDLVQTAPYAIARFELFNKRLIIAPQLRVDIDYYRSSSGDVSRAVVNPSPRLFAQVALLPERLWLKLGAGIFAQAPQGQQLTLRFGNPLLDWQYGATYVLGIEANLTQTLNVQAQGFYKDLRSLVVTDPDPDLRYSNGGLGRVYGGDFLLRQRLWKGLFGWVAYTLSRSERRDSPDQAWRLFAFDQTHILTLIASYKLPWWGLEAGVRFRYVTGSPTTPTIGGRRNIAGQSYDPVQGPRLSERLPDFHQLDIRIDKTFTFNRWRLGLYLDVQNIYNHENTETLIYGGRQLYQTARISGIPVFPNIGVRADF